MTREELKWVIYERTLNSVDEHVLDCILELIAAERERMTVNSIHSCHPECDRPGCVALRKAVEAEREACARILDSVDNYANPMTARDCAEAIRARGSK